MIENEINKNLDGVLTEKNNIKEAIESQGGEVTCSLASYAPAIKKLKVVGDVDDHLDIHSTNPVQNQVITAEINRIDGVDAEQNKRLDKIELTDIPNVKKDVTKNTETIGVHSTKINTLDETTRNNTRDITNNTGKVDLLNKKVVAVEIESQSNTNDIKGIKVNVKNNADYIAKVNSDLLNEAARITYNTQEIAKKANKAAVDAKNSEQDEAIQKLKDTTQIADLDVEIRNTGGNIFVSSHSANEIYNYAIKGGNVKIQINDKRYTYVEYKQRTAYFRYLNVNADKVTEESIEIYEKNATFKTVEYKAVFDATPLLTSFQKQEPLTDDFISKLDTALVEKKLIFVSDNDTIYLLISTNQTSTKRTFTGVGERTVYVLSYGSNKIVGLDTHTIGTDIHIFNNENSINILNLGESSTNEEIKEVFTDSFGEVTLPHTNDIFNIYQNSDVSNNGSVESMVEDSYEIRLAVNMSNFENNIIHRVFYTLSYDAKVGVDSLRITSKVDNIINPSELTETKMQNRDNQITKISNEINEYNISAINQELYDLQGAISALDRYLGQGARTIGLKITFVDSTTKKAKTYSYQGGSFVSVGSWSDEPLGGNNRGLYTSRIGVTYDSNTNLYSIYANKGGLSDVTPKQMDEIWASSSSFGLTLSSDYERAFQDIRGRITLNIHPYVNYLDAEQYSSRAINLSEAFNKVPCEIIILNLFDDKNHPVPVRSLYTTFSECHNLKRIIGVIGTLNVPYSIGTFKNCFKLEIVKLLHLKVNVDFKDSPLLDISDDIKNGSLAFMVHNAVGEKPITITLHSSLSGKIPARILQEAQEKQITIAFA